MRRPLTWVLVVMLVTPASVRAGNDSKDPSTWTPVKITGKQKAPEFRDIAEWINGPALTMAKLKGKVVVVHFMAFG